MLTKTNRFAAWLTNQIEQAKNSKVTKITQVNQLIEVGMYRFGKIGWLRPYKNIVYGMSFGLVAYRPNSV